MARGNNFYYQQDPTAIIGASLGRALFGDPAMAAEQARNKAQIDSYLAGAERDRAQGGLYTEQTRGERIGNDARDSLPDLFREFGTSIRPPAPPPVPVAPEGADPLAPLPEAPAPLAPAPTQQEVFYAALPQLIAGLAQVQGDKLNIPETVASLAGYSGNDGLARGALISQGKTPGEEFAVDAGRADAISARDALESQTETFGKANIEGITDRDVARIQGQTDITEANIRAGSDATVQEIKQGGSRDEGIRTIGNGFGQVTSVFRTPERNKQVGGAKNSDHLRGNAVDIVPRAGISLDQVVDGYKRAGYVVRFAQDEGDHYHISFSSVPASAGGKGGAGGKAPKTYTVNKGVAENIETGLKAALQRDLKVYWEAISSNAQQGVLQLAHQEYQRTGNAPGAIRYVVKKVGETIQREGKDPSAPRTQQAAKPSGNVNVDAERQSARNAIKQGADPQQIKDLFRQRTGQNL